MAIGGTFSLHIVVRFIAGSLSPAGTAFCTEVYWEKM
jgi:hypothetical protein